MLGALDAVSPEVGSVDGAEEVVAELYSPPSGIQRNLDGAVMIDGAMIDGASLQ